MSSIYLNLLKNVSPWHFHFGNGQTSNHWVLWTCPFGYIFTYYGILAKEYLSILNEVTFPDHEKKLKNCVPVTFSLLKIARKSMFSVLQVCPWRYIFSYYGICCKRIVFHLELSDLFETWQKLLENVSPWHIHFWKWPANQLFASYKLGYVGISFHILVILQKNNYLFGTNRPFWNMTKIVKKCVPVTCSLLKMAQKWTFWVL